MATIADSERQWYLIYKGSHPPAVANAPAIAEVRGLTAAMRRRKVLDERLTPEERADGVFFYLDEGTSKPRLPRPPSLPSRPKAPQLRTGSRRGCRR
jgi:hypothetical protein